MKSSRWTTVLLVLSLGVAGCQSQNSSEGSVEGGGDQATQGQPGSKREAIAATAKPQSAPGKEASPHDVVAAFLTALRNGDENVASCLLTSRAREETAKRNLVVQPPGAPSATYQVGEVEYATEQKDGAYVPSSWTENDRDGVAHTYQITWVLRRQSDGWRVAGMATQVDEAKPPLFLNFEDPEDMLRKWREADQQLAAENEQAVQQARQPGEQGAATTLR